MIELTCPTGVIFIKKEAIIAFAEVGESQDADVKTQIWTINDTDPFNILEDIATVYQKLQ